MRRTLYNLLVNDPVLSAVMGDRWVSAMGMDGLRTGGPSDGDPALGLQRPFGVFRIAGDFPGMGSTYQRTLEIWIHDEEGSYTRIDSLISRVKDYLPTVVQVQDPMTGSWIQEISWVNNSPDLFDDARRTNTKMASFNLVGSGE